MDAKRPGAGNRPDVVLQELCRFVESSGGQPLEKRLSELAVWFYQNRGSIPSDNLQVRQTFLEKAFWVMIEVNALLVDRLHMAESRGRSERLWLPSGARVNGHTFR